MNIKVIIAVSVIVLFLLGGGVFVMTSKIKSKTTPATTGTKGDKNQESSQTSQKSLYDLLAAGISQKCTFKSTDDSGNSEGTSYVSGGKVRADFTVDASGKVTVSHMISDGKTSYIWTEGETNGFMMTVGESEETGTSAPSTGQTGTESNADLSQKADYNCSAWIPDNSLFNPPSDVAFTDFSQILQPTSMPGGIQNTGTQCAYCETLTGDEKTSCLAALSCE